MPHDSGKAVDADALERIGVFYYRIPNVAAVDRLAAERGYKNRDEIKISPQSLGDAYEPKVKSFFHEHLHEDEEIRYIRDGYGYFDVRNKGDEWVRILLEKDDLIILPPGIYHRFTTDDTNVSAPRVSCAPPAIAHPPQFTHAMRLFKDEPKWTPLNRSSEVDENEQRKTYVSEYLD